MKRTWVSRLAACGRILVIVRLLIAATVRRRRFGEIGEIGGSTRGSRAQARRRRYAGELMAEVNAMREPSIAEHPYRFAIAAAARRSAGRGRSG